MAARRFLAWQLAVAVAAALAVAVVAVVAVVAGGLPDFQGSQPPAVPQEEVATQEQVARGAYLARVGGCAGCHTAFVDGETPGPALTHPSNDQTGDANTIADA